MSDFETIDPVALANVSGAGIPIGPIVRGAEKAYEVAKDGYKLAKPLLKKAYDGLNLAGNVATVGNAIHDGWNYFFGPKPQQPQPQAKGGN